MEKNRLRAKKIYHFGFANINNCIKARNRILLQKYDDTKGDIIMDPFIAFDCPHCQKLLQAGTKLAGTKGKCPNCRKEITVPEKDSASNGEEEEPEVN